MTSQLEPTDIRNKGERHVPKRSTASHQELRAYDEKLHEEMRPMSQEEAQRFLAVIRAGKQDAY
jgi:hypothetical protein